MNTAQQFETMVADAVSIDPAAVTDPMLIREYFTRLPSQIAYWTEKASDAHEAYLRAEAEAQVAEANLYLAAKKDAAFMGEKVTEAQIKAQVSSNPDWVKAQHAVARADSARRKVNGIVDALHAKKDSLVSLGAFLRKEFAG